MRHNSMYKHVTGWRQSPAISGSKQHWKRWITVLCSSGWRYQSGEAESAAGSSCESWRTACQSVQCQLRRSASPFMYIHTRGSNAVGELCAKSTNRPVPQLLLYIISSCSNSSTYKQQQRLRAGPFAPVATCVLGECPCRSLA